MGSSGLYGDVWASWAELIINIAVTLALAPFYGIVGILLGKIASVFIFNVFWKPYYLFSQGFHKSVWEFWKPMTTYYGLFGIYTLLVLTLRQLFIGNQVESWLQLILLGIVITIPLLLLYFLTLFICTRGMKYFVARKPAVYQALSRLTFQKQA